MDEDITTVFLHGFETHFKIQCPRKPKPSIIEQDIGIQLEKGPSIQMLL